MLGRTLTSVAVAASLTTVACLPQPKPAPVDEAVGASTPGADVIVILSDTHRLDHVSDPATSDAALTPNIAALIEDGTCFTSAYTTVPISAPAYATLMTALQPSSHGLLNNQQHLAPGLPLLQESLRRAGYRTAAVIGNPFCSAGHGFARGFDFFWDEVEGRGKEGSIITDEAIRWLDATTDDRPVFLFLAYMDAHTPYISDEIPPSLRLELNGTWIRDERAENAHVEQRYPLSLEPGRNVITLSFLDGGPATPAVDPSPLHLKGLRMASGRDLTRVTGVDPIPGTVFERLDNRAELEVVNQGPTAVDDELVFRCHRVYRHDRIPELYAAGVRSFDRAVGRLLDHLRAAGRYDDAVLIFVSDHGEMLGEHDAWGHVDHLYQETMRIPLVIKVPGVEGGRRDPSRIDLRDLHDLILDLAIGADDDRIRARQARAVVPLLGATYPPEAAHLTTTAIQGDLKVIVSSDGRESVFDLAADPAETLNLLIDGDHDPRFEELLVAARRELAEAAALETLDPDSLSDEERERLHALGYLDSGR